MTLNDFLTTYTFGRLSSTAKAVDDFKELSRCYDTYLFYTPRIMCKDGFSISIQIHNCSYSASENGYRTLGYEWKTVEWGYPSSPIDMKKYNGDEDVGSCSIELLDGLLNEHGGIDITQTLKQCFNP